MKNGNKIDVQEEFERLFRKHITPYLNQHNLQFIECGFLDRKRQESTIVFVDRQKSDHETNAGLN